MAQPRRRVTAILGADEEYSKEIVDDLIHDDAAHQRLQAKGTSSATKPASDSVVAPKDKAPEEPVSKKTKPEPHAATKTYVRPLLRPLARQQKELDALASQGYNIDIILRLARQQTQKKFRLKPIYTPIDATEAATGKSARINVHVSVADLQSLSEQAGDLGTMPHTQLIGSQVQRLWVEELDAVITKLKGRSL